jgi:hypothetical protein
MCHMLSSWETYFFGSIVKSETENGMEDML